MLQKEGGTQKVRAREEWEGGGGVPSEVAKRLKKQKLKFSRSALFHMKTRISLKYFMDDFSSNIEEFLIFYYILENGKP